MLNLSNFVTSITFAVGALYSNLRNILISKLLPQQKGRLLVDTNILKIPLFGDLLLRSEMAGM